MIIALMIVNELLQLFKMFLEEWHNRFIINLIKFKFILFFSRFIDSHVPNLFFYRILCFCPLHKEAEFGVFFVI